MKIKIKMIGKNPTMINHVPSLQQHHWWRRVRKKSSAFRLLQITGNHTTLATMESPGFSGFFNMKRMVVENIC